METHSLSEGQACAYLSKFNLLDPLGLESVADVVRGAWCVRLVSGKGSMVLALKPLRDWMWITAAGAESRESMTAEVLAWVEAETALCHGVGVRFQTVRPGLVRRACALGYVSTPCGAGWMLEKNNEIL